MGCERGHARWTLLQLSKSTSEVLVWLVEAHGFLRVDHEVARVNVVALHDHFKDLRLVHSAFLHEVDHLVLHSHRVVHVVVQLHLQLVFQLAVLFKEVFVINGVSEVLIILRQQVNLAVIGPRVVTITHWVLRPNADVLASAEEQESVDFLVEALPVHCMGQPGERVGHVEEGQSDLPAPEEGVHEEDVPAERHQAVVHDVRVLQVDGRVLDVVAGVEEQFTLTVEFDRLAWLVDTISAFEVLFRSLGQLALRSVNDLVQVVDLTEITRWLHAHHCSLARCQEHRLGRERGLSSLEGQVGSHCKFIEHGYYYYNYKFITLTQVKLIIEKNRGDLLDSQLSLI